MVIRSTPPPPKDNFGRDRNNGGFQKSQHERIAPPKALFRIKDNTVGASYGSLFGVDSIYGKGGVGTRTTHLTSQQVGCWIDVGIFVS